MLPYDRNLRDRSRKMRRNPTEAEALLWKFLRRKKLDGTQWYRQKPIEGYIVDFYCPQRRLVVEADGTQHFSKEGQEHDAERNSFLVAHKLKVLRFSNQEILKHIDSVLERIRRG